MEVWLSIIIRTVGIFLFMLLILPIMGRKAISSLTHFDLLVGLVTASIIALIVLGVVENTGLGVGVLLIWLGLIFVVRYLIQKSKWFHDHIYGKEIVIIKEGKIMEENLHWTGITGEELLSQLRRKNIFQVADVEFAIMETNGDLSVLPKRELQPLKPKDLRMTVSSIKEPQTVMLDGNILNESLSSLGLNKKWVDTELKKIGVAQENVFLAQVDSMGELYIDVFDDAIQLPMPSTKELLLATLEKVQSDFLTYSFETQNLEWKKKYKRMADDIHSVAKKIEPHLKT